MMILPGTGLRHWRLLATALLLVCSSLSPLAVPSTRLMEEDTTRGIWNKRFRDARAHGRPRGTASVRMGGELIGVTIWRLRAGAPSIEPAIAERAISDTPFKEGEHLRLSIEVPRRGGSYLYVIDREAYADGTMGAPYVIFPSRTTPRRGNVVTAGKPVYIPARGDPIPYFTLQRSRNDQVREELILVVSPKPLSMALGVSGNPTRLADGQIARWEQQWGGSVELQEEPGGAGKPWTIAEKDAAEGERHLAQGDPLPQTVYLVRAKRGGPALMHVSLQIGP